MAGKLTAAWEDMKRMDAAALRSYLESCNLPPPRLADQLRCLSYHIAPGSGQGSVIGAFCAARADEYAAADIAAGLSMLQVAAMHTLAEDRERHRELGEKFRALLDRMAESGASRACDIAVLARSRVDAATVLYREAADFLVANGTDETGLLLSGLAGEAAGMDEAFQDRFISRLEDMAGKRPYETASALRAFLEQAGLRDNGAVRRASALMKTLSDSPQLAKEILERDYGETVAVPEPRFIHPQPKQVM